MKLLMANSNVASNVGNDFFYKGIKYVLKKINKNIEIYDGYFQPFNAYKLNDRESDNNYDSFSDNSNFDGIIISGPVLDKNFGKHFEAALKNACANRRLIILLSVGGREYNTEEINHCKEIFSKYPPDVFVSRDEDTYENYHTHCKKALNGLCFAYYANDYYKKVVSTKKFITSCFDFTSEPNMESILSNSIGEVTLKSHGTRSLINRTKYILKRKFTDEIEGYKIIRPCHRPIRNKKFMFFKKNIFSCFTSEPYLHLYSNTSLTVTDRLHAAVVTLTFGNKACLALNSNRTRLLNRVGLNKCINNTYSLDKEDIKFINELKAKQVDFLNESFSKY